MDKFALIGKTLKHSYSKPIHNLLADYPYELIELAPENLKDFVFNTSLSGFNVTIPYKKDILPYLDEVDERALSIGAVNTVVVKRGRKLGFNTDFDGMIYALDRANIILQNKTALILGSGGTCSTALAVAKHLGAKSCLVLSRGGEVNYDNYKIKAKDAEVIINATPVGMYPDNYSCKIDLRAFPCLSGVFDAIYNPSMTKLLYQAKSLGVPFSNGLPMLVAQAKYAMELFLDKKVSDDVIFPIIEKLERDTLNVVLVGMPGSGKSSVGKELAKLLGREFIDTDSLIEQKSGKDIPTIFKEYGEAYFRGLEMETLREVGALSGKVIATGGGVVKNEDNYFPLKQNAVIVYLEREVEKLATQGRPLSVNLDGVKNLYIERKPLYEKFADIKVNNDGKIQNTVEEIIKRL